MTATEFSAFIGDIEGSYSKENIQRGWYTYALDFYKKNSSKTWGDLNAMDMLYVANHKRGSNKADLVKVAFSVLRNQEVFKGFLASLPPVMPKLFEKLIYEKTLGRREMREIAGKDVLENSTGQYGSPVFRAEFCLFCNRSDTGYFGYSIKYEQVRTETWLPAAMKKVLANYFPQPEGYNIVAVPKPTGDNLVFFNAEDSINRELPSLTTYYLQQQIKYSDKGKPGASGMKKLQRTLQLNEFFPEGEFPTVRSLLMSGLIFNYKVNSTITYSHQIIRLLFQQYFTQFPAAPYIFTQLKGFTYYQPSDFEKVAAKNVLYVFSRLKEGEWVDMENLHKFVKYRFIDLLPLSSYKLSDKVYYADSDDEQYDGKAYIDEAVHFPFIIRPFVAGSAFLFGAFGLLELCYEAKPPAGKFGEDWFSEYDGLRAVKLTALGAYVLGLRADYAPPETKSDHKLSPEANSLMIRVEGNPELAHVQLSNYAQKISDNRYQFSPAIFLKECKTGKDIANKITLFRQSLGVKLPPYWEDYLQRLVNNNKLITAAKNISVFRLPADDKELQRLVVHDEVLKKLVIKAEQYYIIIEKANEAPFRNRLKEAGILLD